MKKVTFYFNRNTLNSITKTSYDYLLNCYNDVLTPYDFIKYTCNKGDKIFYNKTKNDIITETELNTIYKYTNPGFSFNYWLNDYITINNYINVTPFIN